MNDVRVINTELALRQGASAPSVSTQSDNLSSASSKQAKESVAQVEQRSVEDASDKVEDAVASLNTYVQSVQRDLQFRLDDTSGKTVITVFDRSTEEVVRQIPDDVALRLARDLQQEQPISLFKAKV